MLRRNGNIRIGESRAEIAVPEDSHAYEKHSKDWHWADGFLSSGNALSCPADFDALTDADMSMLGRLVLEPDGLADDCVSFCKDNNLIPRFIECVKMVISERLARTFPISPEMKALVARFACNGGEGFRDFLEIRAETPFVREKVISRLGKELDGECPGWRMMLADK